MDTQPVFGEKFKVRLSSMVAIPEDNPVSARAIGDVMVDPEMRRVYGIEEACQVCLMDVYVLYYLADNAGSTSSRDDIAEHLLDVGFHLCERRIASTICRLRIKL